MPEFEILEREALLPENMPAAYLETIPIDLIDYDDIGPPPRGELIRSIRAYGVQTPITVAVNDDGYTLIAGRRRIKAADQVGLTHIPALIYPAGFNSTMLLTDHAQRHANPAAELHAIEELQEQGYSEKEIAYATGMTVGTIRNRLKIQNLCTELREAFDTGAITLQVAEGLTKLSPDDQLPLAIQFEETGQLTSKDVRQARRVSRDEAMTEFDLNDTNAPADAVSGDAEPSEQQATLDQFLDLMETDRTSPHELAAVGIACVDTGRWEDVREILQRILELQR